MKPIYFNFAEEKEEYTRNNGKIVYFEKGREFAAFVNPDQTIVVCPERKSPQACRVCFGSVDAAYLVYGTMPEILDRISKHMGW